MNTDIVSFEEEIEKFEEDLERSIFSSKKQARINLAVENHLILGFIDCDILKDKRIERITVHFAHQNQQIVDTNEGVFNTGPIPIHFKISKFRVLNIFEEEVMIRFDLVFKRSRLKDKNKSPLDFTNIIKEEKKEVFVVKLKLKDFFVG